MKLGATINLQTQLILLAVVHHSFCYINLVDEGDCCQLEWKQLIDTGSKRFIPSSAISIGKTVLGYDIYFFEKPGGHYHGAINNTAKDRPFTEKDGYINWTEGYVLSNPHNCVWGWSNNLTETNVRSYPRDDLDDCFGKFYDKGIQYYGMYFSFGSLSGINLDVGHQKYSHPYESVQYLYVDCVASLENQMTSELFDMDLDIESLLAGDEETIATTEVTNESDVDRFFKIQLNAEVTSSLEMKHNTKLSQFSKTKWGIHPSGSVKAGILLLERLLDLPSTTSPEKGYDATQMKDTFTRTGELSFNSKRTVYKVDQVIEVKARTNAKVLIRTKPVQGRKEFTVYYKIKPDSSPEMWTNDRILNTLKRMGFEDLDKITQSNGFLIIPYKGELAIKSGFDTHVQIVSRPLDSTTTADIFKKVFMTTR